MFTNKNDLFLQSSLVSLAMLHRTAACKMCCRLHIANRWISGFSSSSFTLAVSISVLSKWNDTRVWNSVPKASTSIFSHQWSIFYFKYQFWSYHSCVVILLKTFNFLSAEIQPCCYLPEDLERGLNTVFGTGSNLSWGLSFSRFLRAAEWYGFPCVMLPGVG